MDGEYEKCPTCGSKNLISVDTRECVENVSITTGKVLKREIGGIISWQYQCKCGWISEQFQE